MKRNRTVLAILLAAVSVFTLAACSDDEGEQDTTERNEDGEIEEEGTIGVFAFEEGDCILLPDTSGTTAESSYDAVPCDEPHDVQVFGLFDIDGDEFPGQSAVADEAAERCQGDEWDDAFDIAYLDDPDHGTLNLSPSADTWEQGDREVVCLVARIDGEPLTEDLVR